MINNVKSNKHCVAIRGNNKSKLKGYTSVFLTLIGECVDEIIHDAVRTKALCFGQQTQQRGNLQPH